MPKFYTFYQNTVRGYYTVQASIVVIEASSYDDARDALIGLVGGKASYYDYCDCCGWRWLDYDHDVDDTLDADLNFDVVPRHPSDTALVVFLDGTQKRAKR